MDVERSRASVAVHVAWHPGDPEGSVIGNQLLRQLQADPDRPAAERLGIPVWFRTATIEHPVPPRAPIGVGAGERVVVVVVAGSALLADPAWRRWLAAQRTLAGDGDVGCRLVVAAASPAALGAGDVLGALSVLRITDLDRDAANRTVTVSVLAALADLLGDWGKRRVTVFISHAKHDGAALAERIEARASEAKLGHFLDAHQIVEGSRFDSAIREAIDDRLTALVAVVTDEYATREWCRLEALWAKRRGVPFVILDAIETGVERSLAIIGNVPVVRLGSVPDVTVDLALIALLREVVRGLWFEAVVAGAGGSRSDEVVMSSPPELLTLLDRLEQRRDGKVTGVVYPDPPLPTGELEVLAKAVSGRREAGGGEGFEFLTPIALRCRGG